jgi:cysteinyl-tRNA synthetase
MSTACLGDHFDIHGGGMDLKFPHHENEIAQSVAATGDKFVNTWMHVGFVRLNEEKMSKSLGNFFTVRDILAKFPPEVVRYFILASHYRSPLDYSDEHLHAAWSALDRFYIALRGLMPSAVSEGDDFEARFHAALEDDFNIPKAFAELSGLVTEINKAKDSGDVAKAAQYAAMLRKLGGILGMFQQNPEEHLKRGHIVDAAALTTGGSTVRGQGEAVLGERAIDELVARRQEARRRKNWVESDRIRDQLKAQGIILEDTAGQTTWRRQ